MLDTSTTLNISETLDTATYPMGYVPTDWNIPTKVFSSKSKFRGRQYLGHKAKALASRRKRNKAAKKARRKNR